MDKSFRSLYNKKPKKYAKMVWEVRKIWRGCGLEKGNFILMYELIYDPNWKIWPYLFSLPLYSTFNFNKMWLTTCFNDDYVSIDSAWKTLKGHNFLTVAVASIQPTVSVCLFTFLLNSLALHFVLISLNTEYVYLRLHNQ